MTGRALVLITAKVYWIADIPSNGDSFVSHSQKEWYHNYKHQLSQHRADWTWSIAMSITIIKSFICWWGLLRYYCEIIKDITFRCHLSHNSCFFMSRRASKNEQHFYFRRKEENSSDRLKNKRTHWTVPQWPAPSYFIVAVVKLWD